VTPGIYTNITPEEYHADAQTPEPALSASGIKLLLSGSPAEFAAHSPRLTSWPELCDSRTRSKDLGTIVHSLVLQKGAGFHACDPEDCPARTKKGEPYQSWRDAAKEWKEEQEASGIIVMSRKDGANVQSAAEALGRMLQKRFGDWPIGDSEVAIYWERPTEFGPIWCRALLDHLSLQHLIILDPKSTEYRLADHIVRKKVADEQWAIQAAWYTEAVEAIHPEVAGRMSFRFPLVEFKPPFQRRMIAMSEARMSIARQRIDRAANLFAKCLRDGVWPEYEQDYEPEVLTWELQEWEAENDRGDE
jgi:hypothetical protein